MKKDKKWLISEFRNLPREVQRGHGMVKVVDILPLIDQLDEPEKIVIPQFVADEFDYNKKPYWEVDESRDVSHILKSAFANEGKPSGFLDWVRENPEDYVMAVRNGYEVKKEKLYQVFIPAKDNTWEYYFLDYDGGINAADDLECVATLTKSFIRSISDDLWQFAVEVAE